MSWRRGRRREGTVGDRRVEIGQKIVKLKRGAGDLVLYVSVPIHSHAYILFLIFILYFFFTHVCVCIYLYIAVLFFLKRFPVLSSATRLHAYGAASRYTCYRKRLESHSSVWVIIEETPPIINLYLNVLFPARMVYLKL